MPTAHNGLVCCCASPLRAIEEVHKLGGNPKLEAVLDKLAEAHANRDK